MSNSTQHEKALDSGGSASIKRVVVVEDQTVFRELLVELLRQDPRFEVSAQFGNGSETLAWVQDHGVDMLVVDLMLPDCSGLELLKLKEQSSGTLSILVVTAQERGEVVREVLEHGADGIVTKTASLRELRTALESVATGKRYLCETTLGLLSSHDSSEALSPREREVVVLVAQGLSTKEIAERLHISQKTVSNHRQRIANKLKIHDVASLTRYAIRHGWVNPAS